MSARENRASSKNRIRFRVGSNQSLQKLVFIASQLDVQQLKRQYKASEARRRQVAAWHKDLKLPSLSNGQCNLKKKMQLQLQLY